MEIVVPVRDEERDLGPGIRRLAAYLSQRFPFRAVVTITENAGSGAAARITAWARGRFTAETVGGVTVHDLTRAR